MKIIYNLLLSMFVLFSCSLVGQERTISNSQNCCGSVVKNDAMSRNARQNCLENVAEMKGERIMAGDIPQKYSKFTYPKSKNNSKSIKSRDELRTNVKYEVGRLERYRINTKLLPENARILFFSDQDGEVIKMYEILPSNQLKLSYPQSEKEKVKILNNSYITAIGKDVFMIEDL